MIEAQQAGVQYGRVFGLERFLLCVQEVVFLCEQFYRIFHADIELFADEGVAGFRTLQLPGCCHILLLCAVGGQPEAFDRFIERFLVVQQVQLAGLLLQLRLVDGAFRLPGSSQYILVLTTNISH